MKKNMTPSERREAILNVLCKRRQDTVENLAHEFGVSVRTIKYDIEELTLTLFRTSMKENLWKLWKKKTSSEVLQQ